MTARPQRSGPARLVAACLWAPATLCILQACGGRDESTAPGRVSVTVGSVRRSALATGHLQPRAETRVTSESGGVLAKLHVRLGQQVEAGDLLAEVRPVVTDRRLLNAERALESALEAERAADEFAERDHLAGWLLGAVQGEDNLQRMARAARRGREAAEQQLQLLRDGRVEVGAERRIDFGVRAPVSGQVIDLPLREGSPVVPTSIYGNGTVLMTLADLRTPVFRGQVDETDVARLEVGTAATVRVGALPGLELTGTVTEIGLRGIREGETVRFSLELDVEVPPEAPLLRAGYSAVAELVLAEAENVLLLPERCIDYRDGSAFALVPGTPEPREQEIDTGLSDGMHVEVRSGLQEGDVVLERDWSPRR